MLVRVGNIHTHVLKATNEERTWLLAYMAYNERGMMGRKVARNHINMLSWSFHTGLLGSLQLTEKTGGPTIEVEDARVRPCSPDYSADLAWLRDYQRAAVDVAVTSERGILQLPTGAGKGEIVCALTRALPCRWLALVHRAQLADDLANRYESRTGLPCGRVFEGSWQSPEDARLTCATFQTVHSALKRGMTHHVTDTRYLGARSILDGAEGVVVDEAHSVAAATFSAVLAATPNAYYRYGLSGTPLDRKDGKDRVSVSLLGRLLFTLPTKSLIALEVLAKPHIRMIECHQPSPQVWPRAYRDLVVRSEVRNACIVHATKLADKPGFVFVNEVAHGKALAKALERSGIRCEFVWGDHSVEWRKSHVKRLVQGHFDVLVCSSIFQDGIDCQELRSVVIACGGESVIATLQRLGRGMRIDRGPDGSPRAGGATFQLWDILDTGNKHLDKHARARRAAYKREGHSVEVVHALGSGLPTP